MNFEEFKNKLDYDHWINNNETVTVRLDQETEIIFELDDHETMNVAVSIQCENGDVYNPFSVDYVDMGDEELLKNLFQTLILNVEYILKRQEVKFKTRTESLQSILEEMKNDN